MSVPVSGESSVPVPWPGVDAVRLLVSGRYNSWQTIRRETGERRLMVDASLVAILACPETHQPVQVADAATVAKVNAAIAAGSLENRDGEPVTEAIQGGLVREDGVYLYVVRDDIPVMLIGEAVALADLA